MLRNRNEIRRYALEICIPMLETATERRLSGKTPEVMDTIGYTPTLLEELFRPFWGITPILREDEPIYLNTRSGKIEIGQWLREVLVAGTNPENEYSWDIYKNEIGEHSFHFQNITEIAGLMVGMYFAREKTWDLLSETEQNQVASWIYEASRMLCIKIAGNNHIWFPLLCLLVLKKFGFDYPETESFLRQGMEKLDSMYVGGGWYSDGEFGRIDYYEAWSMHAYPLLWCLIEDESFSGYAQRREKYLKRTELFLVDFVKFFDRDGAYPAFGRSLSYRFAAVCVFPLAVLAGCEIDCALAKTITVRNISYFEENVQLSNGILPPGFLYNSPALVESYTSSGGAYWSAKSFICLLMDETHPFWSGEDTALPIEQSAYIAKPTDERLNFAFAGDLKSGVTVYNNFFQYYQNGRYCNPFNDMAGYYNKFAYNSRSGFALSTRDNTSLDNMIGVSTADGSMNSHRWGFTDLGCQNGYMHSLHTPFSNDPETTIETFMKPLADGWHIRVHIVKLSREYKVSEGGFSIGLWNDWRKSEQSGGIFTIRNRELVSRMRTAASVNFKYEGKKCQPGMHLLAPFAVYPTYATGLLGAGEYIFASVFGVHDSTAEVSIPEIRLEGCKILLNGEELKI